MHPDEPFRRNCSWLVPDSRNNFCNYIYIYICVCVCVCMCVYHFVGYIKKKTCTISVSEYLCFI